MCGLSGRVIGRCGGDVACVWSCPIVGRGEKTGEGHHVESVERVSLTSLCARTLPVLFDLCKVLLRPRLDGDWCESPIRVEGATNRRPPVDQPHMGARAARTAGWGLGKAESTRRFT
ncbi:unnamed protein product [Mesocestoides corti]|nr:unnamed protein product [Mesocestoides corti]